MDRPLYSIIIPTYNCEQDIDITLKSIFNQDFSDYEIIVVDGGSTDNTLSIVKNYGTKVQLRIGHDNSVYEAMNVGISVSLGKYLYFIGAGDILYVLCQDILQLKTKRLPDIADSNLTVYL